MRHPRNVKPRVKRRTLATPNRCRTPHWCGQAVFSQVQVWSAARIAGLPIEEFCRARGVAYDKAALAEMALRTRNAYYRIVGQKGATFYGIASGLVRVSEQPPGLLSRSRKESAFAGTKHPPRCGPFIADCPNNLGPKVRQRSG
jgi:hypothetical protein